MAKQMHTLKAFTDAEYASAKRYLATKVAGMMGRKFEEGDWTSVYCAAKGIPEAGWSNLRIDVNYEGLGVEHKLLGGEWGTQLKGTCGQTLMHPAATRSIRIDSNGDAEVVKGEVFQQYRSLIRSKAEEVQKASPKTQPDLRIGWLLWERSLSEFMYFENPFEAPDPKKYYAVWNETPARGSRKPSKSLWIYEKGTDKKRYSVTTNAGIKIQPYFDVPPINDPNLYWFRVQGESVDHGAKILIWITQQTARELKKLLGLKSFANKNEVTIKLSDAIAKVTKNLAGEHKEYLGGDGLAEPIEITAQAYEQLKRIEGVSDEHRVQLLIEIMHEIYP